MGLDWEARMIGAALGAVVLLGLVQFWRRGPVPPALGSLGDDLSAMSLLPKGAIQRRRSVP